MNFAKNKLAKRRHRLFRRQRGLCHWCGCQCIEPGLMDGQKGLKPNHATLDHLDDRWSMERGQHGGSIERTVMACHKCNQRRNEERLAALAKEEIQRRCNRQTTQQIVNNGTRHERPTSNGAENHHGHEGEGCAGGIPAAPARDAIA